MLYLYLVWLLTPPTYSVRKVNTQLNPNWEQSESLSGLPWGWAAVEGAGSYFSSRVAEHQPQPAESHHCNYVPRIFQKIINEKELEKDNFIKKQKLNYDHN